MHSFAAAAAIVGLVALGCSTQTSEPEDGGTGGGGTDGGSSDGGTGGGGTDGGSSDGGTGGGGTDGGSSDGGRSSAFRFPTIDSVGTPDGWQPTQTIDGDYTISTAGAVVQDIRVNGRLLVRAENVTIRRVEVNGGDIHNAYGSTCYAMTVEDTSILGGDTDSAVARGNYTLRNVLIDGASEGPRIGGGADCGPVTIEHTFVRIVSPPNCESIDWHGDALQGYQGAHLTIRDSVLWNNGGGSGCQGANAAFFYPDQGNTSVTVDGLIVRGGGYSFRLGTPGTVNDLFPVSGSWAFGPSDVDCSLVTAWSAYITNLDAGGQPVVVSSLPCD